MNCLLPQKISARRRIRSQKIQVLHFLTKFLSVITFTICRYQRYVDIGKCQKKDPPSVKVSVPLFPEKHRKLQRQRASQITIDTAKGCISKNNHCLSSTNEDLNFAPWPRQPGFQSCGVFFSLFVQFPVALNTFSTFMNGNFTVDCGTGQMPTLGATGTVTGCVTIPVAGGAQASP